MAKTTQLPNSQVAEMHVGSSQGLYGLPKSIKHLLCSSVSFISYLLDSSIQVALVVQ